jgi:hypothetical protein
MVLRWNWKCRQVVNQSRLLVEVHRSCLGQLLKNLAPNLSLSAPQPPLNSEIAAWETYSFFNPHQSAVTVRSLRSHCLASIGFNI